MSGFCNSAGNWSQGFALVGKVPCHRVTSPAIHLSYKNLRQALAKLFRLALNFWSSVQFPKYRRSEDWLAATIEWDERMHYGQGLHVDRGWKGRLGASTVPFLLENSFRSLHQHSSDTLKKYIEGCTRLAFRGVMDLFSSIPMALALYMGDSLGQLALSLE